ncbi:MAG: PilZ domain-containing protein [Polyangiaceae bacterium]
MSGTDDRRAPGATRIPFEALVEVGGALGPSFEAQAIDISEEGMHLRTAYLPEIGQPLSCRFDAGAGGNVIAAGEVIWKQDAGKGGEFGIRFTDLDPQSAEALQRVIGIACAPPAPAKGNRVRLHIEGLGSPMRAHVKESGRGLLTAFSGLGFLQVGKHLELEDAATGAKRPAKVVRVECEIDPESRVPQLVMSFQYEDQQGIEASAAKEDTPEPVVTHDEPSAAAPEDESLDRASSEMRGFVARSAAKVTPALERLFARAKMTAALLAAKRRGGTGDDIAIPLRRRTSPPPQGGLHASGRKVVRDSMPNAKEIPESLPPKTWTAKRIGIGAGVAVVAIGCAIALHKPSAPAATAATDTASQAGAPLAPTTAEAPLAAPPSVLSPVSPAAPSTPTSTTSGATEVAANDVLDEASDSRGHHRTRVAPFSNGAVSHGNVLRIKMDGEIEKIEGDGQPTGFTVVIPGRRSLEPAAPLAARDGRIASIRVTNDGNGAELTVAFKDGVPNYLVRAKGDVLEIVLAPTGSLADAQKPAHPAAGPATHRHHHKHTDKTDKSDK